MMAAPVDFATRLEALADDAYTAHGLAQGLHTVLTHMKVNSTDEGNAAIVLAYALQAKTNRLHERICILSAQTTIPKE